MMRRKGIFTILAAVFMVLAFSAMAFAANQVFLKTTVPNIPKSTCWQAGTDTMEFDSLTNIEDGDVIQFTLNNKVTICKQINMFLTLANTAGALDTSGDSPVSTTAGTITAAAAGQQWGFLIQGNVGSQIISLTLRQVDTAGAGTPGVAGALDVVVPGRIMTFTGTALTDKMVVKLFDGKIGVFAASGFQKQAATPVAGVYDTIIVSGDNALCIDTLTQDYQGEYVQNTPNSIPVNVAQKINFSGDYTIAHIMAAATLNIAPCKGTVCGHIELGSTTQTTASCVSFDYETNGVAGYCSDHKATIDAPRYIIQSSQAFEQASYTVTAEILVNGVAGEHGVYFSNALPSWRTGATSTCGSATAFTAFGAPTYRRGDGTTAAVPVAPIAGDCAGVKAAAKAVKFVTPATALFATADQFFLDVNLPPFNYNLAEVNAGDVVSVRLTISKATCGTWSFDLCMGTFGCPAAPIGGSGRTCPFFTSLAAGDSYWNGLALVNTSALPATVTLTAYKADNTTATATVDVPANGVKSQFVSDLTWTGTTPSDVPAYITAASTAPGLDAFVMMADGSSNSMGYLCR